MWLQILEISHHNVHVASPVQMMSSRRILYAAADFGDQLSVPLNCSLTCTDDVKRENSVCGCRLLEIRHHNALIEQGPT
jgi:hypothetical protein